jgi:hypothetical protein
MTTGSYRFPLGPFQCVAISDGIFDYPLDAFFASASREEVLRFSSCSVRKQVVHEHLSDRALSLCGPWMLISDELSPRVCGDGSYFGNIVLQHQRAQGIPKADRSETMVCFGQGLVLQSRSSAGWAEATYGESLRRKRVSGRLLQGWVAGGMPRPAPYWSPWRAPTRFWRNRGCAHD